MALHPTLLNALVEIGFAPADIQSFEGVLSEYFLRVSNDELSLRRSLSDTQRRYSEIDRCVAAARVVAQKLGLLWPDLEAPPQMPLPAPEDPPSSVKPPV